MILKVYKMNQMLFALVQYSVRIIISVMNSHGKVFSNQINIYNPHLLYYYIIYFLKNRIWVHYEIVDDFECIVIVCTSAFYPYILNQNI